MTKKTAAEKADERARIEQFLLEKVADQIARAEAKLEAFNERVEKHGAWDAIKWRADAVGEAEAVLGYLGVSDIDKFEGYRKGPEKTLNAIQEWIKEATIRHLQWSEGTSTCAFTNALELAKHQQAGRTIKDMMFAASYAESQLAQLEAAAE